MFRKKLKVKIPKTTKCTNCGSNAPIEYKRLTHDNVLVVIYLCKCKRELIKTKQIDFI